jgi:hypothetical protein
MNKLDALRELLTKVEAGDRSIMDTAAKAFPPENAYGECTFHLVARAYNGSLDAAKALHEAVLGGWTWATDVSGVVMKVQHPTKRAMDKVGKSSNPARAWLIAILKALIAKENSNV